MCGFWPHPLLLLYLMPTGYLPWSLGNVRGQVGVADGKGYGVALGTIEMSDYNMKGGARGLLRACC